MALSILLASATLAAATAMEQGEASSGAVLDAVSSVPSSHGLEWLADLKVAFSEAALTIGVFIVWSAGLAAYRHYIKVSTAAAKGKPVHSKEGLELGFPKAAKVPRTLPQRPPKLEKTEPSSTNAARTMVAPCSGDLRGRRTAGSTAKSMRSPLTAVTASSFATPPRAPPTHVTDALAAAVRSGRMADLPRQLDAAYAHARAEVGDDSAMLRQHATQHLLSVLRACAAAHRFREALGAYRHVADRVDMRCKGVWSLLLYNAVEGGAFDHCRNVLEKMPLDTALSSYDLVNIVRVYAHWKDVPGLRRLLDAQCAKAAAEGGKAPADALTRNRALAACVTESALEVADAVLTSGICSDAMDPIAYNTLMKGFARNGQLSRCLELRGQMKADGLQPSEVTFGILLDASISARDFDGARRIFEDLQGSGVRVNAVHFTTFIKGLVAAGHFDEADAMLGDMRRLPGLEPDLVTYSTLVKAYSDRGQVGAALRILDQMLGRNIRPDEVIFNSVLLGCACPQSATDPSEVLAIFERLVSCGLRPSTATMSIVLKALLHGEAWTLALHFVEEVPRRFGAVPAPRLYAQLAQACIKAGHACRTLEIYSALARTASANGAAVSEEINSRLLRQCAQCGKFELASQIIKAATEAGSRIDPQVVALIRDTAQRRGKSHVLSDILRSPDA